MAADLVELRMNVAALKRVDPYIKDILGTATQVALYTFSALKNEWEKTDVEGALFVCSRNGEPYNSILIMNRLNTNNLVEPIVKDLDWQMQAPFLLYRNPRNNIFGIWFYNRDECVKTTYLLETIMESLNKQDKVKQVKKSTAVSSGHNVSSAATTDIFSMLSKAQEDFNKTPVKTDNPQSSTPRAPDVTSQSVMDFFAKASTTKTSHPTPARIPTGDNEPLQPLLHRLMSNPAHSVEHIEKQQRAVTPQETPSIGGVQPQQQGLSVLRAKSLQNKLEPSGGSGSRTNGNILNLDSTPTNGFNLIRVATPPTPTPPRTCMGVAAGGGGSYYPQHPQQSEDQEIKLPRIPTPPPVESYYRQFMATLEQEAKLILPPTPPPLGSLLDTSQKPQLMPPMMFAAAAVEPTITEKEIKEPMTKKQMAQAFMYLLKNDPVFLDKLHEGYVKSFQQSYS